MPSAVWNGVVLAESDETRVVEGNHYFPPESIRWDHFQASAKTSFCPWKGRANYYSVVVDGKTNRNAAWYYPHSTPAARYITGYVAFWHGVSIERGGRSGAGDPAERVGLLRRLLRARR